ncbi:MAG: hypothetical protein DHS20C08_15940 [Rhodomicrobium sp.]|nr:MAG: hypothetical protein DHS20C08_15940 [Rhodomicrobium sp.]
MAKKLKGDQVFTGQLLREGDVVFMSTDGAWSKDLQSAVIGTSPEEVEALEALALKGVSENIVIDIYPFVVVKDEAGKIVPDHIREKIRIDGPSIVYEPSAQAAE